MISGVECKRARIEEIMEYMAEASDVLFEGEIVRVLQKLVARYPVGTRLKLSTGETSVVLRQTTDSIRPVVGVLDDNHRMTDKRYSLDKETRIGVLQIES
jgi:hypothetical protein